MPTKISTSVNHHHDHNNEANLVAMILQDALDSDSNIKAQNVNRFHDCNNWPSLAFTVSKDNDEGLKVSSSPLLPIPLLKAHAPTLPISMLLSTEVDTCQNLPKLACRTARRMVRDSQTSFFIFKMKIPNIHLNLHVDSSFGCEI